MYLTNYLAVKADMIKYLICLEEKPTTKISLFKIFSLMIDI